MISAYFIIGMAGYVIGGFRPKSIPDLMLHIFAILFWPVTASALIASMASDKDG